MNKEKSPVDSRHMTEAFKFILDYINGCDIDDETRKLADDLLRCAIEDLDACELLYKNKNFSQSIYFLQQSVEKASKSYVLYSGNFSKREIRQISHNSPEAFVRLLDKMSDYAKIIGKMYPNIKTDTTDIKNLIKDEKKRLELAKMDYKAFKVIFNMYDNIEKEIKEKLTDINKLIHGISLQNLLIESCQGKIDNIPDYVKGKDNMEIIDQYCNIEGIKSKILESIDFTMLYALAGFTFPHEQFTRYPDKELKPLDYTKNLGIVKASPEMIAHLRRIYKNIECNFCK